MNQDNRDIVFPTRFVRLVYQAVNLLLQRVLFGYQHLAYFSVV